MIESRRRRRRWTDFSPSNSPDIISFSPTTTSEIFYSQVASTQLSTPTNFKSSSSSSSSWTHYSSCTDEIEEEEEEIMSSSTIINYDQHFLGIMPLMVIVSEEQQKLIDKDDDDQISPMHSFMSRPKPYQDFLDEITRKELEANYNTWKEAKQLKLINRLRMKEAAINAWELKQRRKAKIEMKRIEEQLERKRSKAIEEMQMKISNIKKKAEKMKARERQLTMAASKISMISRITDKIKATGDLICLKCLCC